MEPSLSKLGTADIQIISGSESNFSMTAWSSALANFIAKNQGMLPSTIHLAVGKLIPECKLAYLKI